MLMAIGEAVDVANDLRKAAAERDKAFAISEKVYADAGLAPVHQDSITIGPAPGITRLSLRCGADSIADLDAARRARPPRHAAAAVGGRLAAQLRRLVGVVPPGLRHAARVARLDVRLAEHVPVGDPVRRLEPARHPVVLRAQHAIERPAGEIEALAIVGRDRACRSARPPPDWRRPRSWASLCLRRTCWRSRLRSASPGVSGSAIRFIEMSKSNSCMRERYCTGSTTRTVASTPSAVRFLM